MYHYIRPFDKAQPYLYYLNLDDFRRQLDYFEKQFGILKQEQWQAALRDPQELPDGVLLTFDDGLIDHYKYVWPELHARGHWGVFYISSGTLQAQQLLNVHRVHYLLGRFGGTRVLKVLETLLDDSMLINSFYERLKVEPYSMQDMDETSLQVKRIVNYSLKPSCKDMLLSQLFQQLVGKESDVALQFYMSPKQIIEMASDGFTFGAHGKSHNLLTKFDSQSLTHEVTGSIKTLNEVLPNPSDTFCYPYGGPDSWNEQVLTELQQQSINYGFCVRSADIAMEDIQKRPLLLPRYDCNEFPYGKARIAR
jgi:peptidoglycan/xylan/chitin deacetylase (PgdA/CDA1 family)